MTARTKGSPTGPTKAVAKLAREEMMREVGQRLCWTRLALAKLGRAPKKQHEFAQSVGIPKTSYNQYETGVTMLVPENAVKIYMKYGVSLDWLYAGTDDHLPNNLHRAIEEARGE